MSLLSDAAFRDEDHERRIADLETTQNRWRQRGLKDFDTGHGLQEFGGGLFRLDQTGMQFRLADDLDKVAIYALRDFELDPTSVYPRADLLARIDSSAAAPATFTYMTLMARAASDGRSGVTVMHADSDASLNSVQLFVNASDGGSILTKLTPEALEIATTQATRNVPLWFRSTLSTSEPVALSDGMLWYRHDLEELRLRSNGATQVIATEEYVDDASAALAYYGAATTVANTTTETAIASTSVGAGLLGTNRGVRITLGGTYLNNSGAGRSITFRIKFGSTTLWAASSGGLTQSANTRAWRLQGEIWNVGATNSQALNGSLHISSNAAATTGQGALEAPAGVLAVLSGSASEDTTSAKTFSVTVEHSAADSNLSIVRNGGSLELI